MGLFDKTQLLDMEFFLTNHGYEILDKEFSCFAGSINYVCKTKGDSDEDILAFVEVNASENDSIDISVFPKEAATWYARERFEKIATCWLDLHPYINDVRVRCDVLAVKFTDPHRAFARLHTNVLGHSDDLTYDDGYKQALDDVSEKIAKLLSSPNKDIRNAAADVHIVLGELAEQAGLKD